MAGPLSVTATAGGNAQPGILLRVLVLTGAVVPAVPNAAGQSGPAAHAVRLTPELTGSWIVSATINLPFSAAAPAAAAGNTVLDAVSDTLSSASQDYAYGTFRSGTTSAGTAFTAGSTDSYAGGAAAVEVIRSGSAAIAVDGSSPNSVSSVSTGSPVTSVTTATFTPPSGALLVALVAAAADPFGTGGMSLSDSSGLQWTQAASAAAEGNGYTGVWWAVAPSSLTVTTTSLPAGTTFLGYGSAVQAAGGFQPYSWSIASGSLPSGLNLFPDGTIRGQATAAASSTFTAKVTDASGATATSSSLTLTIADVAASGVSLTGSWLAKAAPYSYGTLSVPVASRDHDWLFVSASWEDGEDVALAFVADDAHNVYRPMYYTTTGTIRTQVYMVNNARPAGTVYISTSAFVRWLTVSIHSFGGMAPWPNVDLMVVTPNDGPSTTFDMGITTNYADLLFATGAFAGTPTAVQVSGSGATWNEAGSHSSGDSTSGISQQTAWAVNTAAGSSAVNFTRSDNASHTYSGGIIAVRYNVPALVNPNPAWPLIYVQAAFGYSTGNPTDLPEWTDISNRFLGLSGTRGRSFELDELTASDLELTLDNFDGVLTPFNQRDGYDLDLMTPVRIFADWQGRRYTLAAGLITAVPQTYDFQRGIVKIQLSDDYAKLPQIIMPSCMISELLYDEPLDLWPLNDQQGATFASNWSGRSTATLIPTWGKYGGGVTNQTPVTGFGNSTSSNQFAVYPTTLMGTTDNVWGQYTNLASGTLANGQINHVHGSVLAARNHTNLPMKPTGATFEIWASLVNTAINWATGATLFSIGDAKGTSGGGNFLTLAIPAGTESGSTYTAGADVIVVSQGSSSSVATHSFRLPVNPWTKGGWHHYAATVDTAGHVTVYQDGVAVGTFTGKFPSGTPDYISFGGNPFLSPQTIVGGTAKGISQVSSVAGMFMGYLANAVVYDRAIDAERILTHYQSGSTGFVGESAGLRIQRFLNYSKWSGPQAIEPGASRQQQLNYLGGGYASSGLSGAIGQYNTGGGGFSDQGAQVDVSIQDVAAGELGFLFVASDGTLTFRQRNSIFNQPVVATIGDMDFALNKTDFSDWIANAGDNCTTTLSSSWSYSGGLSALLTVTGGGQLKAQPQPDHVPVGPGDTVGGSGWVMSPQGAYVYLAITYWDASGNNLATTDSLSIWCPPLTPVFISIPQHTVPANCASVTFHPVIDKTPAAGTELYCDRVRLSPAGPQVPYNSDVEINVDVQYLYNDVVITRNYDQATYRAYDSGSRDKYYPRVFTRTIYTDLADTTAVVDIAQWLISDYRAPQIRVSRVVINPAENPDSWYYALSLDIGDLVTFERNPVGGDPVFARCQVLSIEYDIQQDKAEFTYVLAPSWGAGVVTLDDPVYGVVGGKLAL